MFSNLINKIKDAAKDDKEKEKEKEEALQRRIGNAEEVEANGPPPAATGGPAPSLAEATAEPAPAVIVVPAVGVVGAESPSPASPPSMATTAAMPLSSASAAAVDTLKPVAEEEQSEGGSKGPSGEEVTEKKEACGGEEGAETNQKQDTGVVSNSEESFHIEDGDDDEETEEEAVVASTPPRAAAVAAAIGEGEGLTIVTTPAPIDDADNSIGVGDICSPTAPPPTAAVAAMTASDRYRHRLLDFFQRYDPMRRFSDEAIDALVGGGKDGGPAGVPEHLFFSRLLSGYGLSQSAAGPSSSLSAAAGPSTLRKPSLPPLAPPATSQSPLGNAMAAVAASSSDGTSGMVGTDDLLSQCAEASPMMPRTIGGGAVVSSTQQQQKVPSAPNSNRNSLALGGGSPIATGNGFVIQRKRRDSVAIDDDCGAASALHRQHDSALMGLEGAPQSSLLACSPAGDAASPLTPMATIETLSTVGSPSSPIVSSPARAGAAARNAHHHTVVAASCVGVHGSASPLNDQHHADGSSAMAMGAASPPAPPPPLATEWTPAMEALAAPFMPNTSFQPKSWNSNNNTASNPTAKYFVLNDDDDYDDDETPSGATSPTMSAAAGGGGRGGHPIPGSSPPLLRSVSERGAARHGQRIIYGGLHMLVDHRNMLVGPDMRSMRTLDAQNPFYWAAVNGVVPSTESAAAAGAAEAALAEVTEAAVNADLGGLVRVPSASIRGAALGGSTITTTNSSASVNTKSAAGPSPSAGLLASYDAKLSHIIERRRDVLVDRAERRLMRATLLQPIPPPHYHNGNGVGGGASGATSPALSAAGDAVAHRYHYHSDGSGGGDGSSSYESSLVSDLSDLGKIEDVELFKFLQPPKTAGLHARQPSANGGSGAIPAGVSAAAAAAAPLTSNAVAGGGLHPPHPPMPNPLGTAYMQLSKFAVQQQVELAEQRALLAVVNRPKQEANLLASIAAAKAKVGPHNTNQQQHVTKGYSHVTSYVDDLLIGLDDSFASGSTACRSVQSPIEILESRQNEEGEDGEDEEEETYEGYGAAAAAVGEVNNEERPIIAAPAALAPTTAAAVVADEQQHHVDPTRNLGEDFASPTKDNSAAVLPTASTLPAVGPTTAVALNVKGEEAGDDDDDALVLDAADDGGDDEDMTFIDPNQI